MEENWLDVIPFFKDPRFYDIARYLASERKTKSILPAKEDVFKALHLTPFDEVKVVILGQDPYPNKEHAMGLAFSVPTGTKPLPPTLKNIFKEIDDDYDLQHHYHNPDLTRWARQGVLLLNTTLTLEEGKSASHKDIGWNVLTDQIIKTLSDRKDFVVFILWGQHALNKSRLIDEEKHRVLGSAHPSPLSAHRGFFGSKPFSKANEYLAAFGANPISWT